MKKILHKSLIFTLLFFIAVIANPKEAKAYQDKYSVNISLEQYFDDNATSFYMPKDGTISVNLTVEDEDTVPGNLTFAVQTDYSPSSQKIKEVTGITSSQGITDLKIDLKKGYYYLYFKLNNETGDLSDTSLGIKCNVQILPAVPENVSELTVNKAEAYEDITSDDFDTLQFGDQDMNVVLPFTVDNAGALLIAMASDSYNFNSLTGKIYQDKACTKPVGNSFTLESYDGSMTAINALPKKGTYYIKFTMDYYDPAGITEFKVKLYSISGEARTLTDTTLAYQDSDSSKITYKVAVKSTGLVTFAIFPNDSDHAYNATVQLLDKDKKKLKTLDKITSQLNSSYDYDPMAQYYVLPKGTYYIQVDTDCGLYELDYVFSKVTNQAASTQAKATAIKVGGKQVAGYYTISDKTSSVDWFKFTLSSTQYIKVTVGYYLDGNLKYEILDSKGKVVYNSDKENKCLEGSYYYWSSNYFSKGTYYIKVYKSGNTSSASYSILVEKD